LTSKPHRNIVLILLQWVRRVVFLIFSVAIETGFVKRKGKITACEFVCLRCFMDVEVANHTLVTLCTKLSAKTGVVISNQALDQRLNEKCS